MHGRGTERERERKNRSHGLQLIIIFLRFQKALSQTIECRVENIFFQKSFSLRHIFLFVP